ncbi:MAG: HpaII family restriction endonuclease [Selenomonadaceae bacterium]|nr:HpaII family restriction endonuclease [Selenomonadaceae bacterium]
MIIHDIQTGINNICGFSIKSELGSAPTLLNASGATNFVYKIEGLNRDNMDEINSIDDNKKLIHRIEAIKKYGSLTYFKMNRETFKENLSMIDTAMDYILASILLESYSTGKTDLQELIELVSEKNPLRYTNPKKLYTYKIKKLLCSVALGMVPATEWDGHDKANGGYIIVTQTGNVVAYHIYNRDFFETYLLEHTKLDRPSTTRYNYGEIYLSEGSMFINLNIQIRFK